VNSKKVVEGGAKGKKKVNLQKKRIEESLKKKPMVNDGKKKRENSFLLVKKDLKTSGM